MPVIDFDSRVPSIGSNVFIAPTAYVIGDVEIADSVTIFFGAVLRGDIQKIRIGAGTNLQEGVLVHTSHNQPDAVIGKNVTVGHHAIVHGCEIEDECLIGMNSVILDGAVIGRNSIIGANALIPVGTKIPPRSLVVGTPGRVMRSVNDTDIEELRKAALHYQELGLKYRETFRSPGN